MDTVDVVVVTYNRLKLLKKCLASIKAQGALINKIFIINNASTDGTSKWLSDRAEDKQVDVYTVSKNLGGAAGFELGIKRAVQSGKAKYLWIMDDDTIPQSGSLKALVSAAHSLTDRFGFLCSNVRWVDGSPANVPITTSSWPDKINNGLVAVKSATFVSLFTLCSNIIQVGLPIGQMQIWGDDTEYSMRLSRYSQSFFVSNSRIVHQSSYNAPQESFEIADLDRLWRYRAMFRNRLYIAKMYSNQTTVIKLLLKNLSVAVNVGIRGPNRLQRVNCVLGGTFNGLRFRPVIKFI